MALTLTDLVAKIADVDHRDRDQVHTQIRNPAIRTHLVPISTKRGRTTAITYDQREVTRARIFLALMDIGYDARLIASVAKALAEPPTLWGSNPPSAVMADGGIFYPTALEAAIRGVADGETWDLTVRFTRDQDGQRGVRVYILWDGWEAEVDRTASALADRLYGQTLLGELRLPLTQLAREAD